MSKKSATLGKEIEFKYKASIDLNTFDRYCKSIKPNKRIKASGYDYFFGKQNNKNSFFRYRIGRGINQLTFKNKIKKDNYIRVEHNLDLQAKNNLPTVASLVKEVGYTYNFTLYKSCSIYIYEDYTLVYYICYDSKLKEIGKFIEIELAEDVFWSNNLKAYRYLCSLERKHSILGLKTKNRVKQSLWEMFRI